MKIIGFLGEIFN